MKLACTLPTLTLLLLASGCSSGSHHSGGDNDDDQTSDGPELSADDLPGVAPCPEQEILTDAAMLATFKTALAEGSYLYLDVPFNGGDADIYKKKCGFEEFWNPAHNTDEIPPASPPYQDPVVLSDLFTVGLGNAGICSQDFTTFADMGLPAAGVYRKEFKVSHDGASYHCRVRVTVSGDAAGGFFSDLSITVPDDLEDTLGYEIEGVATDHDDVLTGIIDALEAPDAALTLELLDAPGGNVLLSAEIVFLCVELL